MESLWKIFYKLATMVCGMVVLCASRAAFACTADEIDVLGDGTQCEIAKFIVNTINLTAVNGNNGLFYFQMSVAGTFYVDCGVGGILQTGDGTDITNNTILHADATNVVYRCKYSTTGSKTIKFGGVADTGSPYNTNNTTFSFYNSNASYRTPNKIASVDGSLGALFPQRGNENGQFPRFYQTFYFATNLRSIPSGLFSGLTGGNSMFYATFQSCVSLEQIPYGLFDSINIGAEYLFGSTFQNCTSLLNIPSGLFSNITTGANGMFQYTFYQCTSLRLIPGDLFSNITTVAQSMFNGTFSDCTNLGGYIPPTAFAGLINAGHPKVGSMWNNTFRSTQLATSCDEYSGTVQFITGYEGTSSSDSWNNRVACGCASGYWGDGSVCTECTNKPENSEYTGAWVTNSCPYVCDDGYHTDNDICVGNVITINWTGASAADIATNEAGTATYGGDIRTPVAATPVTGKTFKGWRFSVPAAQLEQP